MSVTDPVYADLHKYSGFGNYRYTRRIIIDLTGLTGQESLDDGTFIANNFEFKEYGEVKQYQVAGL
ncbi:hypothetical protein [Natronococcus jeotgali]|uniref:hypothetical protein n=1 Tax=Natronococcus jeotgali TaxID=413812 RepID=UPI00126917E3|nr:hypothetical protein [Natronococcus jeotgali]